MSQRKKLLRLNATSPVVYIILIFFSLTILIPIYLSVSAGFKTVGQLLDDPVGPPNPFTLSTYEKIFNFNDQGFFKSNFFIYSINSIIVMVVTVALDVLIAGCAGFALSRFKIKGRGVIFNFLLVGLLFPITLAMLPLYIQLRTLNLLDTHLGVILPQVSFLLPFHIMIFRGFLKQIPNELEDACTIDGYGKIGFMVRIVLPLSGPCVATASVLAMVTSWNNYMLPLIFLIDKRKYTLPLGSMDYIGQYLTEWNQILAFFTLCMIPAIVFYVFAQKYIVTGLTAGAVKG